MTEAEQKAIEWVKGQQAIRHYEGPYPDVGMGDDHDVCLFCDKKSNGFMLGTERHEKDCFWLLLTT